MKITYDEPEPEKPKVEVQRCQACLRLFHLVLLGAEHCICGGRVFPDHEEPEDDSVNAVGSKARAQHMEGVLQLREPEE